MDKVIMLVATAWSELVWTSERQDIRHEGMPYQGTAGRSLLCNAPGY